jgi:cation diffusion facilitator family transporter
MIVKEVLYRRSQRASRESGSVVMRADAWHHRSDAITSLAAFAGISVALIGGEGWEPADDWAALVAAAVIIANASFLMREATRDLMDRAPEQELFNVVSNAALGTSDVLAIEKLKIRKSGTGHYIDIHVQAQPSMTLHDAHILSGRVKTSIRKAVPTAIGVLIHMEPYEPRNDQL